MVVMRTALPHTRHKQLSLADFDTSQVSSRHNQPCGCPQHGSPSSNSSIDAFHQMKRVGQGHMGGTRPRRQKDKKCLEGTANNRVFLPLSGICLLGIAYKSLQEKCDKSLLGMTLGLLKR
jgi:hypothetical protein